MSLRIQAKQLITPINLLASPEDLTASPWHSPNLTTVSNIELAPDGTMTATKFAYSTPGAFVSQDSIASMTSGETYTISVYAKVAGPALLYGYNGIGIICSGGTAFANYGLDDNGYMFPGRQGVMNMSIEPAANGFYRIAYTFVASSNPDISFWLGGYNGSDWSGNTMTLWGAQLVHRPNLLANPDDFSTAPWYTQNSTIVTDAAIAPDGTMTADKLVGDNGVTIRKAVYQRHAVIPGTSYTFIVYLKAAGYTVASMWHDSSSSLPIPYYGADALLNLTTGQSSDSSVTMVNATNGWYLCYVTATHITDSFDPAFEISLGDANGGRGTPTGNGVDGIYVWGAQLIQEFTLPQYYPQSVLNSGVRIQSRQIVSTNLLTSPEDFSDASWYKANITVVSNAAIAPDGTMTADKLIATNGDPVIEQLVTVTAGVPYTASVYVKAGSASSVGAHGFIWSWYQTDPGFATGPMNYGRVLYTLTNDWQQTTITFTPSTSGYVQIRLDTMEGNWAYAPGDFMYAWGASLTAGATPLLYSNDFANWGMNTAPNDYSVTPDATIAPDGTQTASFILKPAVFGGSTVYNLFNGKIGGSYRGSIYLKSAGYSKARINFENSAFDNIGKGVDVDLNAGTIYNSFGGATGTIVDAGDAWRRIDIFATAGTTYNYNYVFAVVPLNDQWQGGFTGDGTSGIYMWTGQVTEDVPVLYYSQNQLNSGFRLRGVAPLTNRGLAFYIDAANTASNLTTAIADISGNNYSVGSHNATITTSSFQVRNRSGIAPTQGIVATFDEGILKAENSTGTWTLEAVWKNIARPVSAESVIIGRIGCHGGIYCYENNDGVSTDIRHAIKTANNNCWSEAYNPVIATVGPGETVHSVMTYNNGQISSYINGQLVVSAHWDHTMDPMFHYSDDIRIGGICDDNFPQYNTNSDIYKIRCYTTELTAQEVAQNYKHFNLSSSRDIIRAGLITHLDLGDTASYTTGTTIVDISGSGHNGILSIEPSDGLPGSYSLDTSTYSVPVLNLNNNSTSSNAIISFPTLPNMDDLAETHNFTVMFAAKKNYYGLKGNEFGNSEIFRGAHNGYTFGWRIVEENQGTPGAPFDYGQSWHLGFNDYNTAISTYDLTGTHRMCIVAATVSANDIRIWCNGNSNSRSNPHTYVRGNDSPQISDWHAGAGAFQGQLGFFMIYDHALTDAEIAYNYEILRSRYGL